MFRRMRPRMFPVEQLVSANPRTGRFIKEFPHMSDSELLAAASAVHAAWREGWRLRPVAQRALLARRIGELLLADLDECAGLIATEMGKNLAEAEGEVKKCAMLCEYYAEHGPSFIEPKDVPPLPGMARSYVVYQPMGTVFAIMPWNFPFWQVIRFAVPTLVAGNAVMMKHAPNVLGCAEKAEQIIHRALGCENSPDSAVYRNLRMSHEKTELLISQPSVRGVTLTGSVNAGRSVAQLAGKYLKKCVVELGGSDAYVVMADCDLDKTIGSLVAGRILNTGQSCIGPKRLIVDEEIKPAVEKRLVEAVAGLEYGKNYSCLVHSRAKSDVQARVQAALAMGAKVLAGSPDGGQVPNGEHANDAYFNPLVLTDVAPGNPAFDGEIFGPVWSVAGFPAGDLQAAVELHNGTDFGLGGGVFSEDVAAAVKLAEEELDTGMVSVNDFVRSDPSLPFGGARPSSGMGRECGSFGMHEFMNVKSVNVRA